MCTHENIDADAEIKLTPEEADVIYSAMAAKPDADATTRYDQHSRFEDLSLAED